MAVQLLLSTPTETINSSCIAHDSRRPVENIVDVITATLLATDTESNEVASAEMEVTVEPIIEDQWAHYLAETANDLEIDQIDEFLLNSAESLALYS